MRTVLFLLVSFLAGLVRCSLIFTSFQMLPQKAKTLYSPSAIGVNYESKSAGLQIVGKHLYINTDDIAHAQVIRGYKIIVPENGKVGVEHGDKVAFGVGGNGATSYLVKQYLELLAREIVNPSSDSEQNVSGPNVDLMVINIANEIAE